MKAKLVKIFAITTIICTLLVACSNDKNSFERESRPSEMSSIAKSHNVSSKSRGNSSTTNHYDYDKGYGYTAPNRG